MRFLAFLVFLAFLAFAAWARWYFVCEIRQQCEKAPIDVRLKTLRLTDGDKVVLQGYDQFAFDSAAVAARLNDDNLAFLDTLAAILKADTTRDLTITGLYCINEKGIDPPGIFEELGTARADYIRSLLERRGVDKNRIKLKSGESEDITLGVPLLFELFDPKAIPDEFDNTGLAFEFKNMTFSDANFRFNSAEFIPGESFITYADSVKTHLELHPTDKMIITGHTDSKGTPKYNLELGIKRAQSALEYFRELGVTAEILTKSEGENKPIAPNTKNGKDFPEGRQKNRRVNFTIE
ncbi:MAG: OmpA family protein [Saprospiraceae bacterium]